jgi:hypothetical protein
MTTRNVPSCCCCGFESRRIGERIASAHAYTVPRASGAGQPPLLPEDIRQRIASDHASGLFLAQIARNLND